MVSRIAGKEFRLAGKEKWILMDAVRRAAAFSGVEVYTYALMDNHFHLLVRVPPKREVDDEELGRRLAALYGAGGYGKIAGRWEEWEKNGWGGRVEEENGSSGPGCTI